MSLPLFTRIPWARSYGKDVWANGDEIGVRIGADGNIGKYVIGENNLAKPADDDQTIYWQNTDPADVMAWYPFDAQTDVDISNQSKGFADYDFLAATAENQSYSNPNPVSLTFLHQMAKVCCTLVPGDGITADDLADKETKVSIFGFT